MKLFEKNTFLARHATPLLVGIALAVTVGLIFLQVAPSVWNNLRGEIGSVSTVTSVGDPCKTNADCPYVTTGSEGFYCDGGVCVATYCYPNGADGIKGTADDATCSSGPSFPSCDPAACGAVSETWECTGAGATPTLVDPPGAAQCPSGCERPIVSNTELCTESYQVSFPCNCPASPPSPRCGDGIPGNTLGEECDDGNNIDMDLCSNACKNTRCGDGIVGFFEDCDDGNENHYDACSNDCTFPKGACCERIDGAVTGQCTLASAGVQAGGQFDGVPYTAEQNCTAHGHDYKGNGVTCGCVGDSCFNETLCPPEGVCCEPNPAEEGMTYTCTDNTNVACFLAGGTWQSGITNCVDTTCPSCPAPGSCTEIAEGQIACPAGTTGVEGSCMEANERCCQPNICTVDGESINCKDACNTDCEVTAPSTSTPCVSGACCIPNPCETKESESICNPPPGDTSGCFGFGITFPFGSDTSYVEECFEDHVIDNTGDNDLKMNGTLESCLINSDIKQTFNIPCSTDAAPACDNGCVPSTKTASFNQKGKVKYPFVFTTNSSGLLTLPPSINDPTDPFALETLHVWGTCKYTTECTLSPDCSL